MPVITSISQQKKKNRVNVYLDDKFGFGIDLDNFVLLNLRVGQELTETEIEEVVKKAEFQKTYDKLLRFAMLRPRSEKEINDWFRRKEVHSSLFPKLLNKLKSLNLLDDFEFAKWWTNQRLEFKSKSRRIIQMELSQKGIKKEIIDEVLQETPMDEAKMAKKILDKKAYKWDKLEPRLARQKKSQYLAGKGFSWDVVEKVINIEKE